MADVGGGDSRRSHGKKGKKHKKKRRLGIRLDMTPMVDVAFLLLTFFIMTTTMNRPQTMEINLPPDKEAKVEIPESNLMTLRVEEDGTIWWNKGVDPPEKVEFGKLRALLTQHLQQNPKLTTLIKIDRKGKYTLMVDIMDELNLASMQRFSLTPLGEEDKKLLEKAKAETSA